MNEYTLDVSALSTKHELGRRINKLQKLNSIIGSSVSVDSMPHDNFISFLEKVEWKYLARFEAEERKLYFERIFGRIKSFRLGLYLMGVDIGYKRVHWLSALGFITAQMRSPVAVKHQNLVQKKYVNAFYLNSKGEMIGTISKEQQDEDNKVYEYSANLNDFNADDLTLTKTIEQSAYNAEVQREDWCIEDVFDLPPDLVQMIETINKGWQYFQKTNGWWRFDKYREQAYVWLKRNYRLEANWDRTKQKEFLKEEKLRCLTNSLYMCNKYLWLKDTDDKIKGEIKFTAWKSQEVVLLLIDLGLSLILGKLRQIGGTSVIGGTFALKTMLSKNYYCKMCAQKGDKSEEIFEHKVKYPITKLPDHMKQTIPGWSGEKIKVGYKSDKGGEASNEAIFEVCAPAVDAINAGTPSAVLLDEIGFMKLFGGIVSQGRPAMFKWNPKLGKMIMTKQLIAWGTGGNTGGTGGGMETEWKAAKEAFALRNFRHGIVPLFLNYYAKPGHNDEHYLQEKAFYYAKKKVAGEDDPKIVFHQSFPITEDDMFLQSSDTIISIAQINLNIEKINRKIAEGKLVCTRGYFEPIYDTTKPRGEDSYVPFKIIGSRFIPADDSIISEDSPFGCISIYEFPDLNWENRYYKGTDPIITSSGHSKFATTIKDGLTVKGIKKRTVAKMNYKSEDYRYEYLQSLLLNLYYSQDVNGQKRGIIENLEMNVGGEYYNFCRDLGFGGIFMGNKMLPGNLQTSTMDIGISKKGHNVVAIVNRLEEMLIEAADGIDSIEFWVQLKTFVKKQTATGYKYEPDNKKIHWDDEIDSEVYASIAIDCHTHRTIRYLESGKQNYKTNNKLKYYYNENMELRLGTVAQVTALQKQRAA